MKILLKRTCLNHSYWSIHGEEQGTVNVPLLHDIASIQLAQTVLCLPSVRVVCGGNFIMLFK